MRRLLILLNIWITILINVRARYLLLNIGRDQKASQNLDDLTNIDSKSLSSFGKLKHSNMIQPDSSFKSSRQIGQDLNEDYMRRQIVKTFQFDPERNNSTNEKTETTKLAECCMKVQTSPECLDACKSDDNCEGKNFKAAVILLQATKCASFAKKFKECCEALGHDVPIDSKENKMVRDRKLVGNLGKKLVEVRNLVEQNGMEDLDGIDKLKLTTTHNDLQTGISINDDFIESDCVAFDSKFRGEHKCIFPFRYKGRIWKHCTHYDTHGDNNWCSTKVDESGEHIPGHFGHCNVDCDRYSGQIKESGDSRESGEGEEGKDTSIDDIENKFEEATSPKTAYNYLIPNYPLTFFTRRIPLPATQGPKTCLKEHDIECSEKKPCCKGLTCHKYRTNFSSQCQKDSSVSGCFIEKTTATSNHASGEHNFRGIHTPEECQVKCQESSDCQYFVLYLKGRWKGCLLKTSGAKQTIKPHKYAIFGPKYCPNI